MNYHLLYLIFGIIFTVGIVAYWIISGGLRDPKQIYIVTERDSTPKTANQ